MWDCYCTFLSEVNALYTKESGELYFANVFNLCSVFLINVAFDANCQCFHRVVKKVCVYCG